MTPTIGDHITVTRSRSGLTTARHEGVVVDVNTTGGFCLAGWCLDTGRPVRGWFAPAHELVVFGITQTIEPTSGG